MQGGHKTCSVTLDWTGRDWTQRPGIREASKAKQSLYVATSRAHPFVSRNVRVKKCYDTTTNTHNKQTETYRVYPTTPIHYIIPGWICIVFVSLQFEMITENVGYSRVVRAGRLSIFLYHNGAQLTAEIEHCSIATKSVFIAFRTFFYYLQGLWGYIFTTT